MTVKYGFFMMGEKGLRCLRAVIDGFGSDSVAFVVCAADAGLENDHFKEISDCCEKHSILFFDRNDALDQRTLPGVAACFAIAWRWMIDRDDLIVFHDSILPKYRGFSPLVNMLINGEKEIGVSVLHAASSYDTGNIIDQNKVGIQYPITIGEAIDAVASIYVELLLKICSDFSHGLKPSGEKQEESIATYSLWRNEDDYFFKWADSAEKLARFCDAVGYPYGGARCYLNGKQVFVDSVAVFPNREVEGRSDHLGKVIFFDDGKPVVVCGIGLLKILKLRDGSGKDIQDIPFRSKFT